MARREHAPASRGRSLSPSDPGARSGERTPLPLFLVFLSLASLAYASPARATEPSIAFPLQLETLDGRKTALAPGAPVLHVVFFATWCPACVEELRSLQDLEAHHVAAGYRLVLVAVPTRQTRERLSAFQHASAVPGTLLFDSSGSVTDACGASHLPLHLVFDAKGELVVRSESLAQGVASAVERMLGTGRAKGVAR